jgi:hypothetical protein
VSSALAGREGYELAPFFTVRCAISGRFATEGGESPVSSSSPSPTRAATLVALVRKNSPLDRCRMCWVRYAGLVKQPAPDGQGAEAAAG